MPSDLISAVIPAHNAAGFIGEAIRSLLDQDPRPTEVIVVDDGSTDGTAARVRSEFPDVRVVARATPGGPSAARNAGIADANGKYVALLDADDLFVFGTLIRMAEGCRQSGAALAFCDFQYFATECPDPGPAILRSDLRFRETPAEDLGPAAQNFRGIDVFRALIQSGYPYFGASGVLLQKETWRRLGGFDESLTYSEDFDFALRLCSIGNVFFFSDIGLRRRRHTVSLTRLVSNARLEESVGRVKERFVENHPAGVDRSEICRAVSDQYRAAAYAYRTQGEIRAALRCYRRARAHGLGFYPLMRGIVATAYSWVRGARNGPSG